MQVPRRRSTDSTARTARAGFVAAAIFGVVHGAFSIYWGVGGTALLRTVGSIADQFADRRWMLVVVGGAKCVGAVAPLVLYERASPIPRPLRAAMWAATTLLVAWGAVNAVGAALLASRVVPRPADYDAPATLGHALVWDPLFLAWGLALAVGLYASRPERR